MPDMNERHIARFESQLERLVEGAFATFFGRRIRAQDIALQVARAMEDHVDFAQGQDPRPLAPDQYTITLNGTVQQQLLNATPELSNILSQHIVELVTHAGYRLRNEPTVLLLADNTLDLGKVIVHAAHSAQQQTHTEVLQPIVIPGERHAPKNPQLLIGGRIIKLAKEIVNIGRAHNNDVILEDASASRHHVQLRLRFGVYTLFDANSRSGTFVNDVRVTEHRLQPGDTIRIGRTRLIYLEDEAPNDARVVPTDTIETYEPPAQE